MLWLRNAIIVAVAAISAGLLAVPSIWHRPAPTPAPIATIEPTINHSIHQPVCTRKLPRGVRRFEPWCNIDPKSGWGDHEGYLWGKCQFRHAA